MKLLARITAAMGKFSPGCRFILSLISSFVDGMALESVFDNTNFFV